MDEDGRSKGKKIPCVLISCCLDTTNNIIYYVHTDSLLPYNICKVQLFHKLGHDSHLGPWPGTIHVRENFQGSDVQTFEWIKCFDYYSIFFSSDSFDQQEMQIRLLRIIFVSIHVLPLHVTIRKWICPWQFDHVIFWRGNCITLANVFPFCGWNNEDDNIQIS